MSEQYYNYNINLDKYNLLKKIDKNLLDYMIDEMFEIGYSNYVKNFVKKSFDDNTTINSNNNEVTENKLTNKGTQGENIVYDIIANKFNNVQIENTSKKPHSGDINITFASKKQLIVEVKNYNTTVDIEQIEKLKYDMKYSKINCGILISLNSGIVGKKKFELESFLIDGVLSFILYLPYCFLKTIPNKKNIIIHNSIDDSINNLSIKLEFAISIIENLLDSIDEYKSFETKFYVNNNVDVLTEQLCITFDEFLAIKKSYQKLEENITKNLSYHQSTIKEFEFSIKKRINTLITNTIAKNICINKFSDNLWNVYCNKKICGRICLNNNLYVVFLNLKKNDLFYNKNFSSLEIAIVHIKQYINNL